MFHPGTFYLTDYAVIDDGVLGALKIKSTSVPELSSLGLLAIGMVSLLNGFGSRGATGLLARS